VAKKRVKKRTKPKIYIETSIVSYLTARPSRDIIVAAHQQVTREWWDLQRADFQLFVSAAVKQEAAAGDPTFAAARATALQGITILDITDGAQSLAEQLADRLPLPEKARTDALHIAIAVVHGMDYLVTWNCRHIANATLRSRIEEVCAEAGYQAPIICTPDELSGRES
jgi:predicted nucleic acid-binding protein